MWKPLIGARRAREIPLKSGRRKGLDVEPLEGRGLAGTPSTEEGSLEPAGGPLEGRGSLGSPWDTIEHQRSRHETSYHGSY